MLCAMVKWKKYTFTLYLRVGKGSKGHDIGFGCKLELTWKSRYGRIEGR